MHRCSLRLHSFQRITFPSSLEWSLKPLSGRVLNLKIMNEANWIKVVCVQSIKQVTGLKGLGMIMFLLIPKSWKGKASRGIVDLFTFPQCQRKVNVVLMYLNFHVLALRQRNIVVHCLQHERSIARWISSSLMTPWSFYLIGGEYCCAMTIKKYNSFRWRSHGRC